MKIRPGHWPLAVWAQIFGVVLVIGLLAAAENLHGPKFWLGFLRACAAAGGVLALAGHIANSPKRGD